MIDRNSYYHHVKVDSEGYSQLENEQVKLLLLLHHGELPADCPLEIENSVVTPNVRDSLIFLGMVREVYDQYGMVTGQQISVSGLNWLKHKGYTNE